MCLWHIVCIFIIVNSDKAVFKKNVAKQDGAKILLVNFSQQAEEGGSADRVIEYTLHTVHTGRMAGKWRQNVHKLFFFLEI